MKFTETAVERPCWIAAMKMMVYFLQSSFKSEDLPAHRQWREEPYLCPMQNVIQST